MKNDTEIIILLSWNDNSLPLHICMKCAALLRTIEIEWKFQLVCDLRLNRKVALPNARKKERKKQKHTKQYAKISEKCLHNTVQQ